MVSHALARSHGRATHGHSSSRSAENGALRLGCEFRTARHVRPSGAKDQIGNVHVGNSAHSAGPDAVFKAKSTHVAHGDIGHGIEVGRSVKRSSRRAAEGARGGIHPEDIGVLDGSSRCKNKGSDDKGSGVIGRSNSRHFRRRDISASGIRSQEPIPTPRET